MSALMREQQALLSAIFFPQDQIAPEIIAVDAHPLWARGLKAYQSNGHALAQRALQGVYPVLERLLSEESFADLARALWHASPPLCGDIAQWGHSLPAFVAASAQLADEPFLPDVARTEWALHVCSSAADGALQPESLALLGTHDLDTLRLTLAPGAWLLRSPWPVATILLAHRNEGFGLDAAGAALRAGTAEDVVVWRQGFRPCVRTTLAGEADFLEALLAGQTLGAALDAAPSLDIQAWLGQAVQSGLLLAVSD